MTEQTTLSVLQRRLLRARGAAAEVRPATPARALRLSVARAAEMATGLQVSVRDIADETMGLDDMLALLDPQAMLLDIRENDRSSGLAGFDPQARAAAIEMQLLGRLRPGPAEVRPVTATDAALVQPWVTALLKDLDVTTADTALAGWTAGYVTGSTVANARAAGMTLPETTYRVVRLTLALGEGDRSGHLLLALPASRGAAPAAAPPERPAWTDLLERAVLLAPSELRAVLARLRLPIAAVEGFTVGQVLPLHGVTVSSLRLEGPDGRSVAQARLGQVAGMRAARIEAEAPVRMGEIGATGPVPRYPAGPIGGMVGYDGPSHAGQGYGIEDDGPAMMGGMGGMGGGFGAGEAHGAMGGGFPMASAAMGLEDDAMPGAFAPGAQEHPDFAATALGGPEDTPFSGTAYGGPDDTGSAGAAYGGPDGTGSAGAAYGGPDDMASAGTAYGGPDGGGFPMAAMALPGAGMGGAGEVEPGQEDMDGYSFIQTAAAVPISLDD